MNKKIYFTTTFLVSSLLNGNTVIDKIDVNQLKSQEEKIAQQNVNKIKNNPFALKSLNIFIDNAIKKSSSSIDQKITKIINRKITNFQTEITNQLKKQKYNTKKEINNLKESVNQLSIQINELKKIILEQNNNLKNNIKLVKDNVDDIYSKFNNVKKEVDEYTSYVEDKFSLKGVKETELSRILLLKDTFPIKYVKNFNLKSKIAVVLNNNKEYRINSMLNERCRIRDLSRTHIKIQCIDVKDRLFENTLILKITKPENDYILNTYDTQIKTNNGVYPKKEVIKNGTPDLDKNKMEL